MRKIYTTIITFACIISLYGQHSSESILRAVESQGVHIAAARAKEELTAKEAHVGNTLPNPEVGYTRLWGAGVAGTQSEFTVAQGFDFPTAYFQRNKIAMLKSSSASYDYMAERMNILLEAQLLIIEIKRLKNLLEVDSLRYADALAAQQMSEKRRESGSISALEENKVSMQMLAAMQHLSRNQSLLDKACTRLSYISGIEITPTVNIITGTTMEIPSLDSLKHLMREKDPRLLSGKARLSVSEKEKSLSTSMALPKFSAGYKHASADGAKFNGVMLGISLPVWESRHTISAAKLQIEESRRELSLMENEIESEIESMYKEAISLQKLLTAYHADAFGKKNSILLRKALQWGEISILDYFTELETVYSTSESYLQALYDYASLCACLNKYTL
ncbi:MAG: TolC family protein [Flavobacteriales bacterium]|nr:TolC family protein [Flavobacteriales bacterium]